MRRLTLITPTGERPYAFALCQRMMARQDYKGPVRWIVVDDGEVPSEITIRRTGWAVEVIRPEPKWKPGDNTQGRNLNLALDAADSGDVVVFIEDDDWYSPKWLSEIARQISRAELVGEADAVYYNARTRRWSRLGNFEHASLRCSAIRDGALETLRRVLETPYKYYDQRLWKAHADKALFNTRLTVGMKGLPGRAGIALGHIGMRGAHDADGTQLERLIGKDADWYLPLYEELQMNETKWIVTKPIRYNGKNLQPGDEFVPAKRLDAELFAHAKKIEQRTATPAPAEKPKKMKIEKQAEKVKEQIVERAPEPAPEPPEPSEPVDLAGSTEAEENLDAPKPRARRKSFGI